MTALENLRSENKRIFSRAGEQLSVAESTKDMVRQLQKSEILLVLCSLSDLRLTSLKWYDWRSMCDAATDSSTTSKEVPAHT